MKCGIIIIVYSTHLEFVAQTPLSILKCHWLSGQKVINSSDDENATWYESPRIWKLGIQLVNP